MSDVEQCAVCGVYGLPMKMVGSARMCFDQIGCAKRKQARIDDDDDRFLITPLEGPPDPNVPHVTVDCSRGGCRMSFFVARTDPRLPDGPFLCPDHDDVPTKNKVGHTEMTVFCDRCEAQITAAGDTREEAIGNLRALIAEKRWKVVDRFDVSFDVAAQLTRAATSTTVTAPDLCGDCASQR